MKALIKRMMLGALGTLRRDKGGKIVFYHDVIVSQRWTKMGTPFDIFKSHIERARDRNWRIVSEGPKNDKELMIAFDDGFRGIWEAKEYFVENDIFPTISIAIDLVGKEGYLTWAEIRELQSAGFVFQSHTWSHRSLTEVPDSELEHELRDSRIELSNQLGRPVSQLCFPRGMFSTKVLVESKIAGYDLFYTSIPGSSRMNFNEEVATGFPLVPRNLVQFSDVAEFDAVLNGALGCFHSRYWSKQYVG